MFPSSGGRQDYYIFGGGDFSKNLHLTLESWEGAIYIYILYVNVLASLLCCRNRALAILHA